MKRFALFEGEDYYPSGGWGDMVGLFDTAEEAMAESGKINVYRDWGHVVDLLTGEEVFEMVSEFETRRVCDLVDRQVFTGRRVWAPVKRCSHRNRA